MSATARAASAARPARARAPARDCPPAPPHLPAPLRALFVGLLLALAPGCDRQQASGSVAAYAGEGSAGRAGTSGPMPVNVGWEPRFGERAAPAAALADEAGRAVRLGDYFDGKRPVVLVLAYYECPMLCSMVLQGLTAALRRSELSPGQDYQVVVVSIDPADTPERAGRKKASFVERLDRPGGEGASHFLTGSEREVRRVAEAVGFRFEYDAVGKQFAHPAGAVVLAPDGTISRYLYGIDFPPRDLRLALVEAAGGKVGGARDRLLLLCYRYDPEQGRYGAIALASVRAGGVVTVALLGTALLAMRRRGRKEG